MAGNDISSEQTLRLKNSRKVTLELRPEHSVKKNKTSNPTVQESDNLKSSLLTKTNGNKSGKVVLELREEPCIKVIKNFAQPEVVVIIDDDDDDDDNDNDNDNGTNLPPSTLLNDPENNSTQDAFEVDVVDDNYVSKSIISIEKNQSIPYTLPEPSKENPYLCCGHSFYNQLDIKLHKESHRQQKSYQCDYQQLNDSVNSSVSEKCEKSKNSHLTDTQTSLPLNDSTNLTPVNKHFDKEKSPVQYDVLEFSTSQPIDFIVNEILEKQKKLCQYNDAQQLKSVSFMVEDLTANEKCEEQKKSNQCSTQQLVKSSDVINGFTINKNCDKQNKTDKLISLKLPSSTTIELISNKKSVESNKSLQNGTPIFWYSGVIDLTVDKKSDQCDTQQCDKLNKSTQSATTDSTTDKGVIQQSSVCNSVNLNAINKNSNVLNTIDLYDTQQLSLSDSIEPSVNKNCANKQTKSNICNIQQLPLPVTNLTHNKRNGQKTVSLQCDLLQSIDTIDLTYDENHDEPYSTDKNNTEELPESNYNDLNATNTFDKQKTALPHDPHQFELTDTTVLTNNQNSDKQSKSNLRENDFFDFTSCELSFDNKIILKFRKNPKKRLYKCDICQMSFFASYEFIDHVKIHEKKKIYTCKFCKQEFSIKSDLKIHLKTHKKRYKCDFCKLIFNKKSDFMCHVQTHIGNKPFKCTKCKMSFNRKSLYLSHKRNHIIETSNECHLCFRTFFHESSLKKHLVAHSQKILFQCNTCQIGFNKKSNLVSHIQTHMGKESHKNSTNRKNRVNSHAVKSSHNCQFCNRSFETHLSLLSHVNDHYGLTKYQCKVCSMYFPEKWLLKTHTRMMH